MAMLEKHYSHIVMRKFAHRIAGDAKTTLHKRKALVSAAALLTSLEKRSVAHSDAVRMAWSRRAPDRSVTNLVRKVICYWCNAPSRCIIFEASGVHGGRSAAIGPCDSWREFCLTPTG